MGSLLTLLALIRKELTQALRDKRMLTVLIFTPIIQLTILGYAANLEFNHAHTVVVDEDRSERSRAFLESLGADGTFVCRPAVDVAQATDALRSSQASVAVIVPRGFGRHVEGGMPVRVQVLVDGSDPVRSIAASAALEQYAAMQSVAIAIARLDGVAPPIARVSLEPRLLYNPSLKSRIFIVPGTGASILLIVTTIVTAMGLAREREVGTMEQLLVTPIRPIVLMIGKTVPYALFGLFDEVIILVVANVVFDVPLRGPIPIIFLGASVYLLTTLAIGLLIGTIARTQQQALMGGFFFIIPAILLSGFMTPVEAMPSWIQPITWVNPMRYFVEILRSNLLRGAGLADVMRPLSALALLGVGTLGFAAVRFRRTLG